MIIVAYIFKAHLQVIYFFLKLLPINDKKVFLVSGQSNARSIDFLLIEKEMLKLHPDHKVIVNTKKIEKKVMSLVMNYFNMYRQMYHLATSKVCVSDSYIVPVSVLKHKRKLKVIHLCHGVGNIKQFGYQTINRESSNKKRFSFLGDYKKLVKVMRMHKGYDYLISTSSTTSKFYAEAFDMDENKMPTFGPPKIDYLLNIGSKKEEVLKRYPELKNKPVILYVSTFRTYQDDYLDKFIENLPLDKYNIIMHLHHNIISLQPELAEKLNRDGIYRCKDIPTVELLSIADYAITDYSSFAFESAILNIPTYFFVPDYEKYVKKVGLNVDIYKELPNCVFKDAKELFKAISNNDYDHKTLETFKKKHIENTTGNSTKKLIELMIEKRQKA